MTTSLPPQQPVALMIEQALHQALAHHQAGQPQEAEKLYRAILQIHPNHPEANHNMGVLAVQTKHPSAGLPHFMAALEADPTRGQYWLSYIDALFQADQLETARQVLAHAQQQGLQGDEAEALAVRLEGGAQVAEQSNAAYHQAFKESLPVSSAVSQNSKKKLKTKPAKPDKSTRKSAPHKGKKPSPQEINTLVALASQGRFTEAATLAQKMTVRFPLHEFGWKVLGVALKQMGRDADALAPLQKAATLSPNDAEAHSNLGLAFNDLGRLDEAEASCRRVLEIKPDFAVAHCNLGLTLQNLGRLDEAAASYRRALEIKPDFVLAHSNLGFTLQDLGRLDEAAASYRRALEIKPDFSDAHDNLLFLYGYHALIDPHDYLAQARNWEQACLPAQDRQTARHRVFQRSPLAGRRLRVGYVSGDYRQHAVSYFIEQLFAHHDRARIELFAYSTQGQRDAVTERLQALAEHWVPLAGIPDAVIRDRIEADGIDVLIDLSGHTKHNRLGVFARRAAPVQAHYLGYFASTGLTEMDYWIGDEILTPAGTDSHFSEQVWRLPRVWVCYDGKTDAPVPDWRPSQDGTIWLGSFNNLGKLTPATLALWAKVLRALPEGKLLLKTKDLRDIGNRQRILNAMSGHGILPDRIELRDSSATPDWSAHMTYYDRLDIALDPVGGVGGGTTTCDALWMGVPVITCEGDRMASRMTASMLNAIGHPEWIARSEAEYIDKVVTLARNVEQRKALRSGQRNRMASSPLCDGRGLAMSLENAYFEMFERWFDEKN